MPTIKIHPAADRELEAAFNWYEHQAIGLGLEYLDEIDRATSMIAQGPHIWPRYTHKTRRFLIHRFPFAIIYRHIPHENKIEIVAVMHLRRKPGYWKHRI